MKSKALNIKIIELIVIALIWMAVFSIPFFSHRINNSISWSSVNREWIRMGSFLIIFLINVYFLVPKYLFQKKYLVYIGFSFLAILLIVGLGIFLGIFLTPTQPIGMPPMDLGPGMPPMELGGAMPPPIGYKLVPPPEEKSVYMNLADNIIIAILIVGAGTAVKILEQWLNEEGRRKDIEKEQLKTELAFLRHQVSPHFLMNTLNNIHALIDINSEDAKNSLIELSTMMRYMLYETAHGQTTLKKEIAFITSYINLMQLRFPKKVTVNLDVPDKLLDAHIPPMLFISFLENAFKHGVGYQTESYVSFKLEQIDKRLKCIIKNSKHNTTESIDKSHSGIGLTNIRKSLILLFDKDYLLDIHENEKEFEVQLTIPLHENNLLSH
jgi:hypothetical protein